MVWMEKKTLVAWSPVFAKPMTNPNPISLLARTPLTLTRSLIRAASDDAVPTAEDINIVINRIEKTLRIPLSPKYSIEQNHLKWPDPGENSHQPTHILLV